MRIALDAGTDVGKRAARILLSDNRCEQLVLTNKEWIPNDRRVITSSDISEADVFVSDGTTPLADLTAMASLAHRPLVLWRDETGSRVKSVSTPVVTGANVASTLAPALMTHPGASPGPDETSLVAWTEPGKPARSGTPIGFPSPVGMAWGKSRAEGQFVAFRDDEWAGATAVVTGASGNRSVGVADIGTHLEALTLVAVAIVASTGVFEVGFQSTRNVLSTVLAETRVLELDIAVWKPSSVTT